MLQHGILNETEVQMLLKAGLESITNNNHSEEMIEIHLTRMNKYALDSTVSVKDLIQFGERYWIERKRAIELGADATKMRKYDQQYRNILMLRMGGTGIQN
jgi:hypothetical protein